MKTMEIFKDLTKDELAVELLNVVGRETANILSGVIQIMKIYHL